MPFKYKKIAQVRSKDAFYGARLSKISVLKDELDEFTMSALKASEQRLKKSGARAFSKAEVDHFFSSI